MKISPVKGTRDFYPPQMAVHNFILDGWKRASLRNGFEEYDGPIFEYLKMYKVKSGDEIVDQLFNLTDRGGRDLAIRPEITPTLARMVNQQVNSLPRPVKWFSVPRLCRAERPQKGRLREFYQWNIDIIGIDSVIADAEIIFTTIDFLKSAGLTSIDIAAKISSRKLLAELLLSASVPPESLEDLYPILDKKQKLSPEAFEEQLTNSLPDPAIVKTVNDLISVENISDISQIVSLSDSAQNALGEVKLLFDTLDQMGIADFCRFDMSIVRGLAYYTGPVFEIHDIAGKLRAICGGGRFDNLLKDFGGPSIPATGMGMGDAVLEILLREKKIINDHSLPTKQIEFFIAIADEQLRPRAIELTSKLRFAGHPAEFSYKSGSLGKQLSQASSFGAQKVIIVGSELDEKGELTIKDMADGKQNSIKLDDFLSKLT